jgi:uncharacterized protein YecE (DUF72 family)
MGGRYMKIAMRASDIEIGTSGWKFDDWAGLFYPLRVPKARWLEYYAARFSIGEINSTYYHIGSSRAYEAIARRTPDSFRLYAKVHADVTHARTDPEQSLHLLLDAMKPLVESGKLLGLLAQFPGSFRASTVALDYVLALRNFCISVPLCVEFRNRSWDTVETLEKLRRSDITWVCPDEPDVQELLSFRLQTTSHLFYLRFHGRNAAAWYDSRAGNCYDYNYSAEELTDFGRALLKSETAVKKAHILFNNCYSAQAPQNALWLKEWLVASEVQSGE